MAWLKKRLLYAVHCTGVMAEFLGCFFYKEDILKVAYLVSQNKIDMTNKDKSGIYWKGVYRKQGLTMWYIRLFFLMISYFSCQISIFKLQSREICYWQSISFHIVAHFISNLLKFKIGKQNLGIILQLLASRPPCLHIFTIVGK